MKKTGAKFRPVSLTAYRGEEDLALRLQYLTAAIHAGLKIDMVRTAQLTGILVLDIGRGLQRVGRTAHTTLRRRSFSFWNSHGITHSSVKSPISPWRKGHMLRAGNPDSRVPIHK